MIDGAYWATESALPFDERVLVFPFPPKKIGGEVRVIWSDRTINFTDGVKAKLSSMGVACRQSDIDRIIERLRQVLNVRNEYPKWVLDSEFEELCKTVLANISSEL
jgi:isopropylmalate/homocitrate/citramalate synthase